MIDFVTWSLLVVGVTYAVTCSLVFAVPRLLIARLSLFTKYFVYCAYCVSFWAGAAAEILYTNEHLYSLAWFGSLVVAGFVAMGLVSLLKAALPELLVPPFESEQGGSVPDDEQDAANAEPLIVSSRSESTILIGGAPGPDSVKCPHKWYKLDGADRCIVCGADRD